MKAWVSSSVVLGALLLGLSQASAGQGATQAPPAIASATLFQNVRVFDGKSGMVSAPCNVLVIGQTIDRISTAPIAVDQKLSMTAIEGGGRTLMPGLIDAHWHAFMASTPQMVLMTADPSYLLLLAARQAEATLMRGFTTVRDLGGPVFGLKRAIDEGVMLGPRIYPSGAFISQTSGHRFSFELPRTLGGPLSHSEVEGIAAIADSPAAEHHGKGEHETGQRHSTETLEHSKNAHLHSQEAHNKSVEANEK
jgi:imidazolonepropionase-like amidohydrolase